MTPPRAGLEKAFHRAPWRETTVTIELSNEPQAFQQFEHWGWETISDGYQQHFARLTSQAVATTLDAAAIEEGMRVLDVCTGPGMLNESRRSSITAIG